MGADPVGGPTLPQRRRRPSSALLHGLALGLVLITAALLRFTGLSWGLRHPPHIDERYFVENVALMIIHGDLDHRFYEYPGLFFYFLYPGIALATGGDPPHAEAYLAARRTVAAFGVASVGLLYLLGSLVSGRGPALLAAALLAVSPVGVETAHRVRPDVALEFFALLALIVFFRTRRSALGEALPGAALGAATALKFTGLLLVPSYVAHRLLSPGARLRGIALAGLACVLVFAALSPYAVLHLPEFAQDAASQVLYHYRERPRGPVSYWEGALGYLRVWPKALGVPATLLAAFGLWVVRREWRTWLPLLLYPAITVAVFATSEFRFDRHMVPSLGVVALLAAVGGFGLVGGRARLAAALALACLAAPLAASVEYVRDVSRPGTRDRILDWFEAQVPAGSRVITSLEHLGLDPSRYEVLWVARLGPPTRRQVLHADFVVSTPEDDAESLADLTTHLLLYPESRLAGPRIRVQSVPERLRPRYHPVTLDDARLSGSEEAESLPALRDGRMDTTWRAAGEPGRESWVQVDLPRPVLVGRVELRLGERGRGAGKRLRLLLSEDGTSWRDVRTLPGRPPVEEQLSAPSQVLLLEPTRARSVRIVSAGAGARRWTIAELGLDAVAEPEPAPSAPRGAVESPHD